MMHPIAGMLLVLGGIAAAFGLLRALTRITPINPELSRKTLHVALGLGCLTFPWLFDAFWPVLLLCVITLAALVCIRHRSEEWRSLLHGVRRTSLGELCFPVAVTLLFALIEDPIVDYVVPILVLTLADAIGALIGVRYGQSKFTTDEGHKSLEGCVSFFIVAFLSTHLCLLLGTDIAPLDSVLIALIIGTLIMLIEAIAWRGLDNLFIPLGTYLLLNTYMEMETTQVVGRIGLLFGILIFFAVLSRRTYAKGSVLIASALVLYLIWAVGGWLWAVPPLTLALVYCLLCPPSEAETDGRHGLVDLAALSGAGLIWLFLSVSTGSDRLDLAFIASWSAQIAMLVTAFLCARATPPPPHWIPGISALIALVALSPALYWVFHDSRWLVAAITVSIVGGLTAGAYRSLECNRHDTLPKSGRAFRVFAYGLIASTIGLIQFLF